MKYTPTPVQVSKHFGIPYRSLLRWSYAKEDNWRYKLYQHLVKSFIRDIYEEQEKK
jgi:hypothetical protein